MGNIKSTLLTGACVLLAALLGACSSGESVQQFSSQDMGVLRLPNGVVVQGTVLERPGFGNRAHYIYMVKAKADRDDAAAPTGRFSRSDFVKSVEDAGVTRIGNRAVRGFVLHTGFLDKNQFIYFEEVDGQPVAGVSLNTTQSAGKSSYNQAVSTLVD